MHSEKTSYRWLIDNPKQKPIRRQCNFLRMKFFLIFTNRFLTTYAKFLVDNNIAICNVKTGLKTRKIEGTNVSI